MSNWDWSYPFYLFPSIISFLFSLTIIFQIILFNNIKKKFHQLSFIFAIFDSFQCISWFFGPRYETSTTLCHFQEYLFQFGSLGQAIIGVIVCTIISYAIQSGGVILLWNNLLILPWVILLPICNIISICFDTADLFCPFNQNVYYPNLKQNNLAHKFIVYTLSFLIPLFLCLLTTTIHTVNSIYYAQRMNGNTISLVAKQLRWYPLMLVVCTFPLSFFFFLLVTTGHENHVLRIIGAICSCSSGTMNGIVYYTIIGKSKERSFSSSTDSPNSPLTSSIMLSDTNREHSTSHRNKVFQTIESNGSSESFRLSEIIKQQKSHREQSVDQIKINDDWES